jgi:hypothetical protein
LAAGTQKRLGTRVRAQIPLRISSVDPAAYFAEDCYTVLVNPKGCGIRCKRPLEPGLRVKVDHLPGGESATARVACSIPPQQGSKFWLVGIGLEEAGNPWHLAPAPPDWGTFGSTPPLFSILFGNPGAIRAV